MKRLALVAAVLVVAACGKKTDENAMDTTSMTPPAAMTDSGAAMKIDSTAQMLDSTASAAADSIKNLADSIKH